MSTPPPEPVDDTSTRVDTTITPIKEIVDVVPAEESTPSIEPVDVITRQESAPVEPVYLVETTKDQIESLPLFEPVYVAARRASTIATTAPTETVFVATRVNTAGTSAPLDPVYYVPRSTTAEVVPVPRPHSFSSFEAPVLVEANKSVRRSTIRRVNTILKKVTTTKTDKTFTKVNTEPSVVDREPVKADASGIVKNATKKRRFARLRDLIRFVLLTLKLLRRKRISKVAPVPEVPKKVILVEETVHVTEVPVSETPPAARSIKTV
jgi:hypothetical protein